MDRNSPREDRISVCLLYDGEEMEIRQIVEDADIAECVEVIRRAFSTVADDFGLTQQNCPGNTAFITKEKLRESMKKEVRFFGLFTAIRQVGFVGVEDAGDGNFYLEKLAVIPEYRHKGLGVLLMDFIFDLVKGEKGRRISLGMMDENDVLRRWYEGYGFETTDVKRFNHLPFKVRFMAKNV